MPYKSKAEREREQWITRTEAIALIAKLDGCDRRSASKQFANLLGDGVLRFKWEDLPKPIRPVIGVAAPDSMDWRQVRFRRDKVFDQWWTRQWRRPLFHRDDILRPWKESSVASADEAAGFEDGQPDAAGSVSDTPPIGKRRRGPSQKTKLRQELFEAAVRSKISDIKPSTSTPQLVSRCGTPDEPTQAWRKACGAKGVDPVDYPPPERTTINHWLGRRTK